MLLWNYDRSDIFGTGHFQADNSMCRQRPAGVKHSICRSKNLHFCLHVRARLRKLLSVCFQDNGYQLSTLLASEKLRSGTSSTLIDFDPQTLGLKSPLVPGKVTNGTKEPNLATTSGSSLGSSKIGAARRSSSGSGCSVTRRSKRSWPASIVETHTFWSGLAMRGSRSCDGDSSSDSLGLSVPCGGKAALPIHDAHGNSGSSSPVAAGSIPGSSSSSARNSSGSGTQPQLLTRMRNHFKDLAYNTPPWWGLKVLLQYRTLRNYRTPEYLAAHLFDKFGFALVLLSLFWSKGDDFTMINVPVQISLIFLLVAAPAWGAVAYVPSIVLDRALFIR